MDEKELDELVKKVESGKATDQEKLLLLQKLNQAIKKFRNLIKQANKKIEK